MSISKGTRFDVFKRDEFTCQYCGRRPPEVTLEVDHIHPRAMGGDDDQMNLVTACADCNRGKSAKVLGSYVPRPDTDMAWLEMQQELAELKRYNEAKATRDKLLDVAYDLLMAHWQRSIRNTYYTPDENMLRYWIREFGPDEVEYAVDVVATKFDQRYFESRDHIMRYVGGILWKRRKGDVA